MAPLYIPHKLTIPSSQHKKLKRAIEKKTKQVTLHFTKDDLQKNSSGDHELMLTSGQILKIKNAQNNGTTCKIIMRKNQIDTNMGHEGGFLPILAGLAAKFLPTILGGIATGVLAGGVERMMRKKGNGFFLHKNNQWYKMSPVGKKADGLYLSPRPAFAGSYGNGLFVNRDKEITDGSGLIFGKDSPFKSIPLLNLLL